MDHSVAPAAYFIARINHESKTFLRQRTAFLRPESPVHGVEQAFRPAVKSIEKTLPCCRRPGAPDARFAWRVEIRDPRRRSAWLGKGLRTAIPMWHSPGSPTRVSHDGVELPPAVFGPRTAGSVKEPPFNLTIDHAAVIAIIQAPEARREVSPVRPEARFAR